MAERPRVERGEQIGLDDMRAAREVDEAGAAAHRREVSGVEQAARRIASAAAG